MVLLTAITILAAAGVLALYGRPPSGLPLPIHAAGAGEVREHDLDRDGVLEQYVLDHQRMVVTIEGVEVWRSPAEWRVTDFALADATNDGRNDLLLVLWKHGSFGSSKPMWFIGDDNEVSNHLFVYNLAQGKMKPAWCSSALDEPIQELSVRDEDGDGRSELVVQESGGSFTLWRWRDWGFYRADGD